MTMDFCHLRLTMERSSSLKQIEWKTIIVQYHPKNYIYIAIATIKIISGCETFTNNSCLEKMHKRRN